MDRLRLFPTLVADVEWGRQDDKLHEPGSVVQDFLPCKHTIPPRYRLPIPSLLSTHSLTLILLFQSHLLPISPSPPSPSPPPLFPSPPSPPTATTTYVTLSTLLPPTVPIPIDHSQDSARRGFAAMGAVLGIGILAAFGVWFWAARRRARGLVPGLGDGIGGVRYEGEGDMRERERMGGRY